MLRTLIPGIAMAAAVHGATLTLAPAALAGAPGQTLGWGFTIESTPIDDGGNSITPWLLITFADFAPDFGMNPVGVFTPFLTQFPNSNTAVGPNAGNGELNPWTQAYDAVAMTGIGSYQINDFQTAGDSVSGNIVLYYDEYRVSPNDASFDAGSDIIALGQTLTAPASVLVAVPEPDTMLLLGLGVWVLVAVRTVITARRSVGTLLGP